MPEVTPDFTDRQGHSYKTLSQKRDNTMKWISKKSALFTLTSMMITSQVPCSFAFAAEDNLFYQNGHTYAFLDAEAYGLESYREVAAFCRHYGGHLAVINNEEENRFLFKTLEEHYTKTAFFGYSDAGREDCWVWTDEKSSYENWTRDGDWDLPDNGSGWGGDEDYAEFNYERGKDGIPNDGTWNDAPFMDNTSIFICEWDHKVNNGILSEGKEQDKVYEGYIDVLNEYKSNIVKWEDKWDESNRYWTKEYNGDYEFLLDTRQIAFKDINEDGIEELLFIAETDETGLDGAEEYTKDLYIFTMKNDEAVKVFQTEAYAEAAGGWRYLIAETKGHQLAIAISTIDAFEECTMDQYTFDGRSLKQTAHQAVFMDEYDNESGPRYTVEKDGRNEDVSKERLEDEVIKFTEKLETPLIRSGGGSSLEVYDIAEQIECCSMNYREAVNYLKSITEGTEEAGYDKDTEETQGNGGIREGSYSCSNGEYLSSLEVYDKDTGECYLGFWHNYGSSASDFDFNFYLEEDRSDYKVTDNRSNDVYEMTIEWDDSEVEIYLRNTNGVTQLLGYESEGGCTFTYR